jgi:hypothetical protein
MAYLAILKEGPHITEQCQKKAANQKSRLLILVE